MKLFINVVGIIITTAIIAGKSPVYFLSGLGALTAVLILVFKDTILSLVSSIQITSNNLFKVGDYKKLSKLIINFNLRKKINNKKLKYAKDHLYRFDYNINLKKYLNLVNSVSKV